MKKLASILITSRGRFDPLLEAIQSIIDTTDDLNRVEIMLRLDEDDKGSIDRLEELPKEIDINVSIGKRHGYTFLHKYVNEMCADSKGEFLVWFNDDCIIETKGWDTIIAKYSGQIVGFWPDNKGTGSGNIFPIINRKIYEIIGHFSLSQKVDTWQHCVCDYAGIQIKMPNLVFIHNRKQDYVSDKDRKEVLKETHKMWVDLDPKIHADAAKVKRYLRDHKK